METTPTHLTDDASSSEAASDRGRLASLFASRPVSQRAAMLMALAAAMPVAATVADASGYSSIASKEIARRAQLVAESDKAVGLGREAYAKKDFEEAHKQYQQAVNMLPPGPALNDRRDSYTDHLGDAAIALSQKYTRLGKSQEARNLLEGVLGRNPNNTAAKKQLDYLDDPIRNNPALTYEHTQDVDRVRKLLYMGEGYFNLGKYDEAEGEFKKVLQIDKYNTAARRWLERIASKKSDYYRSAYDETRATLLSEVDRAWELSVPPELPNITPAGGNQPIQEIGVQYIQNKLNNIVIPLVDFDNTTVEEALDFLRLRARELDSEPIEDRKGLNFIIRKPNNDAAGSEGLEADLAADAGPISNPGSLRIKELKLRNVPLGTVLQYIVDATRLRFKLDEHSVVLLPLDALEVTDLYTRSFTVPPDFIAKLDDGGSGNGGGDAGDPFGGGSDSGGNQLVARAGARELLERNGVSFGDGAFARHIAATSTLVVRNTLGNLDVIEQIVENLITQGPRQVRIMTKFIEVSQENSDELGFDWIVNPIGIANGDAFIGGGTIGNGAARGGADFANSSLASGAGELSNIATAGLRSGDFATTSNSIDSLLNNPNRTAATSNVAPGILSFTGLFTDGNLQVILRGLAQKSGVDVMTAPSILARSGEKATIEVIREFIYPTEYEPPELPNSVGTGGGLGGGGGGAAGGSIFPVTPATPTAFETRNTGVTLEIEPTIGENNYSIDLRFAPEIVEFEGFINYGSPIQSPATDAFGNIIQITITENRIEMPVFSTRRVNTALTIYDGYTVAVGGLMREDVQNVEDKVPILGDLPFIGRLFQSKAENRIKSNLIIFVTAQIIDAAGAPINGSTSTDAATPVLPGGSLPPVDGTSLLPNN